VNAAAHEKSEVGTNSHHRILKGRMKNGHSANTRRRDSTMPQSGKDSIGIAGCGAATLPTASDMAPTGRSLT
jgi:hypothetical protein